jgi:regulatory protein
LRFRQRGAPVRSAAEPSAVCNGDVFEVNDGCYRRAMERAARLLTVRPRSSRQLRDRLTGAGFDEDTVTRAVGRLTELGLIDDRRFAAQWVQERSVRKGLAAAALLEELNRQGVDRAVAQEVVAEAALDEQSQAIDVATRLLRRVASRPPYQQLVRLQQMLARRGFSPEVIEDAVKAVLSPEGWD